MQAHLRYLAIASEQPDETAEFYRRWFEMQEVGRSPAGDICMTDGWVNVSLLKQPVGSAHPRGLDHFGIAVDDIEALRRRLKEVSPDIEIKKDGGGQFRGEYVVLDPNGTKISLSTKNFNVPQVKTGQVRLRHMSLCVDTGSQLRDFFTK